MSKKSDLKKYGIIAVLFLAFLILAVSLSFFVSMDEKNRKEIKKITVNGIQYEFNTNLYEVIKVPSDGDEKIKTIFERNSKICIKFDNSSESDNSIFFVSSFNLIFKTLRYYRSKGVAKKIEVCEEDPKIEFRGPNTGATETSVKLIGNTILIQGTTPKNLEMATDKLILIIFDIKEI